MSPPPTPFDLGEAVAGAGVGRDDEAGCVAPFELGVCLTSEDEGAGRLGSVVEGVDMHPPILASVYAMWGGRGGRGALS